MNGTVNLTGGWNTLWSAISSVIGGPVMTLLTIIGVILVVGSIITYFFQKRRGGGAMQGLGPVMWTLVCGALLAAPQVIIPLALTLLDFAINTLVAIVSASGI
tara:strand:- start:262 stop:570 length:309 start_codon:yes stop_codon:yes gene_type:complete